MLVGKGVTAWRRVLTQLASAGATACGPGAATMPGQCVLGPADLPATLTAELIDVLAAVALAGTGPDRPPRDVHP